MALNPPKRRILASDSPSAAVAGHPRGSRPSDNLRKRFNMLFENVCPGRFFDESGYRAGSPAQPAARAEPHPWYPQPLTSSEPDPNRPTEACRLPPVTVCRAPRSWRHDVMARSRSPRTGDGATAITPPASARTTDRLPPGCSHRSSALAARRRDRRATGESASARRCCSPTRARRLARAHG